jgi:hypothetical protein
MNSLSHGSLTLALSLLLSPASAQEPIHLSFFEPTSARATYDLAETSIAREDVDSATTPASGAPERFEFRLELGAGTMDHEFVESDAQGSADAAFLGLQFEGVSARGFGGGVRVESIASDNFDKDLLGDDASATELFGFFTYRYQTERFKVAVRPGLGLSLHSYNDDLVDVTIDYSTVFLRIEAEPEFTLIENPDLLWSVYGDLALGYGTTQIDSEGIVPDDDSSAALVGVDLGTRLQLGRFLLGVGYVLRTLKIEDTDLYTTVENEFSGVQISLGIRW